MSTRIISLIDFIFNKDLKSEDRINKIGGKDEQGLRQLDNEMELQGKNR